MDKYKHQQKKTTLKTFLLHLTTHLDGEVKQYKKPVEKSRPHLSGDKKVALKPAHTRAICLAKCHSCYFAQHIAPVCAQFL